MSHYHPYHIVDISPWPLTGAIGAFTIMIGMINWFHMNSMTILTIGYIITLMTMFLWWRDVIREATFQGHHTNKVTMNMRWGMIMFITSEVFFFVSFFWAFFHSSLSPAIEIGASWPPTGITPFNPFQIPLLNTIILLSSGVSITWTHHSIMEKNYSQSVKSLLITILLGLYFISIQGLEYYEAPFSIADSVYGSTFFMATGFHGLHVIIGTLFLSVTLIRLIKFHFSSHHHFGFEAAAWYWHFVDVVWLFLYISIYWWGN
uniref:Cytochrome c oxidase subunit 3 n=1 Tax=Eremobates cf. palpisetulosus SEM-2008 TaxID=507470 RepID=B2CKF1_9ARAC|nr:cytochrome c oxidase subunit III [Eremobates cf. palpisetulosus SEM-2008]ACA49839.1 cytochrome oxidase subunit 3 [Eremobates cf. palpisetulosus SEM-2008]